MEYTSSPSAHLMTVLKIAPRNWLIAAIIAGCDDKGTFCTHDLYCSPLTQGLSACLSPQVPPAMKVGSFFCEEMLSLRDFLKLLQLLSGDSSKNLKPFRLQCVFNILPAPLTIISSIWGHGCGREDDDNVCGSMSWRLLDVPAWKLAAGRGLWWSLWLSGREWRGKKTILSFSQCCFLLYYFMDSFDKAVWICVVGRSCACDQLHLFLTDE